MRERGPVRGNFFQKESMEVTGSPFVPVASPSGAWFGPRVVREVMGVNLLSRGVTIAYLDRKISNGKLPLLI